MNTLDDFPCNGCLIKSICSQNKDDICDEYIEYLYNLVQISRKKGKENNEICNNS